MSEGDWAPLSDAQLARATLSGLRDAYRTLRERYENHGELVRAAHDQLREQGLHTGGIPAYGFKLEDDGRTLAVEPDEVTMVQRAKELRQAGKTLLGIAEQLYIEGYRPRTIDGRRRPKKKFHASQISRMIKRPDPELPSPPPQADES